MGDVVNLDERGRITIPVELRQKYGLQPGDELQIEDSKGIISLNIKRNKTKKLQAPVTWDKNSFLKTGEATFED